MSEGGTVSLGFQAGPGLRSMTGFASIEQPFAGGDLVIEVRSVNHRHLDLSIHLRGLHRSLEADLRGCCRRRLRRGRVELSVRWTAGGGAAAPGRRIDPAAAQSLLREAAELQGGSESPVSLRDILTLPGVVAAEAPPLVPDEALWQQLLAVADRALVQLDDQRVIEGGRLRHVIERDLDHLDQVVRTIAEGEAERTLLVRRRLTERLGRTLADWSQQSASGTSAVLDDELRARVVQEAAVLADRQDTTEEVDRLNAHLAQFRAVLDSSTAADASPGAAVEADLSIGKRLEFLLQEVLRELNTVASKCRDAEVAQRIVRGKALNERLREQVLNLE